MSGRGYFGDATPMETWEALSSDPQARLVDVRTAAEWAFVGIPDLSRIDGELIRIEWQTYPRMEVDPGFAEKLAGQLQAAGASADAPVYFICRSGARSASAAAALTAAGFHRCFNVAGGFEGQRDEDGHRGTVEGWKAANLPWVQP